MSVFQSKSYAVSQVYCCPTMDLMALILTDHTILIIRYMSMERIITLSPTTMESKVTTLTWNPNGFSIALGHENGQISIYDIEKEEMQRKVVQEYQTSPHKSAIMKLQWIKHVAEKDTFSGYVDRCAKYLMEAPSFECHNGYSSFGETKKNYQDMTLPTPMLSILISIDAMGIIGLYLFGTFLIGSINPSTPSSSSSPKQKNNLIMMKSTLDALYLVRTGDDRILKVKTQCLLKNARELHFMTHHVHEIGRMIIHMKQSLHEMTTQWKDAMRIFKAKMGLMAPLFEKYNSTDSPQQHMFTMACSGIASSVLTQFFADNLNERGIGRMQKSFDAGCETLQELTHSHLQCASEVMVFRLCELRGLLKSSSAYQEIGVDATILNEFIDESQEFLLLIRRFFVQVAETRADFSLLFRWMFTCMRKLSNLESLDRFALGISDRKRLVTVLGKTVKDHYHNDLAESFGFEIYAQIKESKTNNNKTSSKSLSTTMLKLEELCKQLITRPSLSIQALLKKECTPCGVRAVKNPIVVPIVLTEVNDKMYSASATTTDDERTRIVIYSNDEECVEWESLSPIGQLCTIEFYNAPTAPRLLVLYTTTDQSLLFKSIDYTSGSLACTEFSMKAFSGNPVGMSMGGERGIFVMWSNLRQLVVVDMDDQEEVE